MLVELLVQRRAADSEHARGDGAVALRLLQGTGYGFALREVQLFTEGVCAAHVRQQAVARSRVRFALRRLLGGKVRAIVGEFALDIGCGYHVGVREHDDLLQKVLQLAHVSRPTLARQPSQRIFRQS